MYIEPAIINYGKVDHRDEHYKGLLNDPKNHLRIPKEWFDPNLRVSKDSAMDDLDSNTVLSLNDLDDDWYSSEVDPGAFNEDDDDK